MYPLRNTLTRAIVAKQRTPIANLQASRNAQRKFATSPTENVDTRRTPMWLYGTVAVGGGTILYLWKWGNQSAKAAAEQKIPEPRGARSEYVKESEGS